MTMRAISVLALVALLGLAAAVPSPAAAAAGAARVTYLAGGSVYVDAGQAEGVREGDTLEVVRDGAVVARLRAIYLSSHRAACDTLAGGVPARVGDAIRFVARLEAPAPVPAPPVQPLVPAAAPAAAGPATLTTLAPNPPRASRLRGRVGLRLFAIQSDEAGDLTQPAADLRFDAVNAGGLPVDLVADVRGRRTTRSIAGSGAATEASTRVYRLAASLHDVRARRRVTVGRQVSPLLSSVSLFDGALAEWGGERYTVGAFGGAEPDPVQLRPSADVVESGGFLQLRHAPGATRRWSVAMGGVTSSNRGEVNRDFLFTQGSWHDPLLSVTFAQEVDIQRGWRREPGHGPFSLTSTWLLARAEVHRAIALSAGYDGRRVVRLYRDRETPETLFDDRFREGAWTGLSAELGRHVRLSGDARQFGAGHDRVSSWSGTGELARFGLANARLRARFAGSRGDLSRTRLASVGLGLDPLDGAHLELTGGSRVVTDVPSAADDHATWAGVDLDLSLLRRLLLSLSWERTQGDLEHVDQQYAGMSWRF
jgi:hypothetical protein